MVDVIRSRYSEEVGIVFLLDSGFMDQKIFDLFGALSVGYPCGCRLYKGITDYVSATPESNWDYYFGDRELESYQMLLTFALPYNVIYANLGMDNRGDEQLSVKFVPLFSSIHNNQQSFDP